jgi:O-acetyl-ADP-ribose deacetylase (regulator of RNase III)
MRLVHEHGLETVAFPAISTGAFGFPIERATRIAIAEVGRALAERGRVERVTFCCFSEGDLEVYDRVASEVLGAGR